tara:strand:+ start:2192 stop:2722 length:531 start_codon:yes stop_codon:yes gene_type:complete
MKNIITIGGSTSKKSINKILAEYVGDLVNNVKLTKVDLNDFEMPQFSVDVETEQGIPNEAIKLKEEMEKADGFVISLAEHNGAYSAAFKNIFDWISRIDGKVWQEKPMLLLATSPGERGGQTVLDIALGRFPYMGGNIVGSLSFPSFYDNFQNDEIINKELKLSIEKLVNDLEQSL